MCARAPARARAPLNTLLIPEVDYTDCCTVIATLRLCLVMLDMGLATPVTAGAAHLLYFLPMASCRPASSLLLTYFTSSM